MEHYLGDKTHQRINLQILSDINTKSNMQLYLKWHICNHHCLQWLCSSILSRISAATNYRSVRTCPAIAGPARRSDLLHRPNWKTTGFPPPTSCARLPFCSSDDFPRPWRSSWLFSSQRRTASRCRLATLTGKCMQELHVPCLKYSAPQAARLLPRFMGAADTVVY